MQNVGRAGRLQHEMVISVVRPSHRRGSTYIKSDPKIEGREEHRPLKGQWWASISLENLDNGNDILGTQNYYITIVISMSKHLVKRIVIYLVIDVCYELLVQ